MFLLFIFKFIFLVLPVLLSVAFMTLLERKLLSLINLRLGPNKVSFLGFFQPISDAIKLSNKESNILINFSFFFYYMSSVLTLISSLIIWLLMMGEPVSFSFKLSFIVFIILLGFNCLNSVILGWSTFSKYSLLGSVRTVSQLISYESVLYLCLFFFLMNYGVYSLYSFNFFPINLFFLVCPIVFFFWLPSFLAELNRTPYDFSEGESELVSGFNTEFGSFCFTMIFLSEYSNIVFFCLLSSFLFFWQTSFFSFFFFLFFVIWVRSSYSRYRFDKLMFLSWKFFIPFLTLVFIFYLNFCF